MTTVVATHTLYRGTRHHPLLSRYTTESEIDRMIEAVPPIIARLCKLSPYWSGRGPVEVSEAPFEPAYA